MAKNIFTPEEEQSDMSAGNFIWRLHFMSHVQRRGGRIIKPCRNWL